MHVVEPAFVGNLRFDRLPKLRGRRDRRKIQHHRPIGGSGDREPKVAATAKAADQQGSRTADLGEREMAECGPLPQRGSGQADAAQQLARPQHVQVVADDEVLNSNLARGTAAWPQRADAFQRGRQRDHRAGRQRHADVAPDGCRVPDFERGKEGIAALAQQRQCRPFRGALETVQLRNPTGRADDKAVGPRLQRAPAQLLDVDQCIGSGLRLGEQPSAATEPGVTGAPVGYLVCGARAPQRGDRVQVHDTALTADQPTSRALALA